MTLCCRRPLLALLVVASLIHTAAPAAPAAVRLLVRAAGTGGEAGRLDVISLPDGGLSASLPLRCERAHYGAGVLACLRVVPGQGLKLDLADRQGKVAQTLNFPNVLLASRVRVSADGALVALTGFSGGHSYTGTDFSTRTYLVDAIRRRLLADVSTFKVVEAHGLALAARRINVWGVSFDPAVSNRFVATVGAAGEVFLAEGDLQAHTLTLLRKDMECPSFSPDGKRIAFKRRDGAGGWLPAVYETASGRETVMPEARSVDDQIEWLDNATIIYELARRQGGEDDVDLVRRRADGVGPSAVLRAGAGSPARYD